jgi:hypothetical protein
LGISPMSKNPCTTRNARLDSVYDDAPAALHGGAERNFRGKKNSAYISAQACSKAHRERAEEPESRESILFTSQTPALGSIWQALDAAQRRSSSRRFRSPRGAANAVTDAAARREGRAPGAIAAHVRGRASP